MPKCCLNPFVPNAPFLCPKKTFGKKRLNGQYSKRKFVITGVPQGSVLGPLFFIFNIKALSHDINSDVKLFADGTLLFSVDNCGKASVQ